jgi:RHS repeat-associated protein
MTLSAVCTTSARFPRPHYTGKERDTESGNDYFGARYYASSMGRFMSPDWAVKITPVPYAKLGDPQSLNLYAYVGNNPLGRVDVDGHEWKFNGNDQVTAKQLQKAFEAGIKAQGTGAWKAYQAVGSAKGVVSVGFGDLKSDTKFGNTSFSFTSQGGKLASVEGSITFNTNSKAMNIGNSTDLAAAGSHEFTHVEGTLASPGGQLTGGLQNLAPHGGAAEEEAAFRNQAKAAFVVGALPGNNPVSADTSLGRSSAESVGKTDAQMNQQITGYGYHYDEAPK